METLNNVAKGNYTANFGSMKVVLQKGPTDEQTQTMKALIVTSFAMLEMIDNLEGSPYYQKKIKFLLNQLVTEIEAPWFSKYIATYWNTENELFQNLTEWYKIMFKGLGNHFGEDELQLLGIAAAQIKEDRYTFAKNIGVTQENVENMEFLLERDKLRRKIVELPNMHLVKSVDAYIENVIKPQIPKSNDSKA